MPSQWRLTILSKLKAGLSLARRAIASDFIRKVAETFATRVVLIGIGLITSVMVARILGPEGRGLYAVATAIGAIGVQFGNLGLHASNTYYVARDRKLLPELVSNTLLVSFGFGGLGSALAWLVFFLWPSLAPVHGLILLLSLVWIPFSLAYMLLQNLLLGIYEVKAYNNIELTTKLLGVTLIALAISVSSVTIETVFSASLIPLIIGCFWTLLRLKLYFNRLPLPSLMLFKQNVSYGIKAYLAAFFAFLVLRGDLFMVQYMLGSEQVGYYSIAVTLADMVGILPVVISTIIFPKLSAISSKREKWKFTQKVTVLVGIVMAALAIFSALVAEPIVRLLFGELFLPAVPAFLWLVPGVLFLGIEVVAVQFLNSIGFPKQVVIIWFFSFLINIFLNYFFIRIYGIVGAAKVSSFSYLAVLIFVIYLMQKLAKAYD
jgi:O-antigen/teichoic acid export membrane protein